MKWFQKFLGLNSGYEQLDLKYIFDHFRNIGISALITIAGLKLTCGDKCTAINGFMPYAQVLGHFVVGVGIILYFLNLLQLIILMMHGKKGIFSSLVALLAIPAYILTIAIFMSQVVS